MTSFEIGTWHERESREVNQGTSYAADYIIHKTAPSDYSAFLNVDMIGFLIPMPQELLVTLQTEVVDGKYYSGFGGVNFASTDAKKGPSKYTSQNYSYYIPNFVERGQLTLKPEWAFLDNDTKDVLAHIKKHGLPV